LTVKRPLDCRWNHSEPDQLIQFVSGDLSTPAVLELKFNTIVELLCWYRSFIDILPNCEVLFAVELQSGFLRERDTFGKVFRFCDSPIFQNFFDLRALENLSCSSLGNSPNCRQKEATEAKCPTSCAVPHMTSPELPEIRIVLGYPKGKPGPAVN